MDNTQDSLASALDAAIRILTRRNHSRHEMVRKLRQRHFTTAVIDAAIALCERLGYMDDDETAAGYFRELVRKGFGGERIRFEMKKKGLSGDTVERMLETYAGSPDETAAACGLIARRMARFERESDPQKRREKIFRFMYSRGFSADITIEALQKNAEKSPSD